MFGMLPTRRRALIMLAGSPDGVTEPVLLAHGFTTELLAALERLVGSTSAQGSDFRPASLILTLVTVISRPPART